MALTIDSIFGPGAVPGPTDNNTQNQVPEVRNPLLDYAQSKPVSGGGDQPLSIGSILNNIPKEYGYEALTPIYFNKKDEGFDKIYNSFKDSLFQELGFVPGQNNEDLYARELGKGGQLLQALKGIGPLALQAHNEAWKTEAGFWKNLFQGNFSKAFNFSSDPEELSKLYEESNKIQNENFIPLTDSQKAGSFNVGKFATGLQQFGFTLGTSLQFLEQSAVEWLAAAALAPETGTGSIWAEFANTFRRGSRTLDAISNSFKKVMKVEDQIYNKSKIFNAWSKLYSGAKEAVNPVNFYRFTKEFNMAAAESKFEKAQSYGSFLEEKENEFYQKNGRQMNDVERSEVEKQALDIANSNGITNTALLYFMNKMNMNNILRSGFGMQRKILAEAGEGIWERVGKNIVDPFVNEKDLKIFTKDWLLSRGKKGLDWLVDSGWEGVQELGQSVSAEYWKDYYTSKAKQSRELKNNWDNLDQVGRSLNKALKSQMSTEGLDTFISGFIIGVPGVLWNRSVGGVQRLMNKEAINKQQELLNKKIEFLNKYANDPKQIFNRALESYTNQQDIADAMDEAVKKNDIFLYKNLNRVAFHEMVMGAYSTGKLDALLDRMDSYLRDLGDDDDFKEVFGLDKGKDNTKSAGDYINKIKTTALEIASTYDSLKKKFPNPFNPNKKFINEEDYIEEQINHLSWDKALQNISQLHHSQKDAVLRHRDILNKASENFGSVGYQKFYNLSSPENIQKEIDILKKEVQVYTGSEKLTKDSLKLYRQKQSELEILEKYQKELKDRLTPGSKVSPVRMKLFKDYINSTNDVNLTDEQLNSGFYDLLDVYRLQDDTHNILKSINFLSDPKNFKDLRAAIFSAFNSTYENVIKENKQKIEDDKAVVEEILSRDSDDPTKKSLIQAISSEDAATVNSIISSHSEGSSSTKSDIEAQRADIEKELFTTPISLNNWTSVEHGKYIELLTLRGELEKRDLLRNLDPKDSWQLYAIENLSEEESHNILSNIKENKKADTEKKQVPTLGSKDFIPYTIDQIKTFTNFQDTQDFRTYLETIIDRLSDKDFDLVIRTLEAKEAELLSREKRGNLSSTDPLFKSRYDSIVSQLRDLITTNPNITEKQLNSIYNKYLIPIINSLNPEERPSFLSKHSEEYKYYKEKIIKRAQSKDISFIKQILSEILNSDRPTKVEDALFYINSAVDTTLVNLMKNYVSSFVEEDVKQEVLNTPLEGVDNSKPIAYLSSVSFLNDEDSSLFSALRQKSIDDTRSEEDLYQWLDLQEGKVSIRTILDKIIESDFSTENEKILANILYRSINRDSTLKVDDQFEGSGYYEPGSNSIFINLKEVSYTDDFVGYPIETVILHEVIHMVTSDALDDKSSKFYKDIKNYFQAAKRRITNEKFYAFMAETEDEQLHEFLVEALTNPLFQNFLSKIEYGKSGKSLWQKFIDAIKDLLASFTGSVPNSVLEGVLSTSYSFLQNKSVNTPKEVEEYLSQLSQSSDKLEITDIISGLSSSGLEIETIKGLESVGKRQLSKIDRIALVNQKKNLLNIKIGTSKYYYSLNNGLDLYQQRGNKLVRIKKSEILEPIVKELIKKHGVKKILGEEAYSEIKEIGGDPNKLGTYANGSLVDDINVGESEFPTASQIPINLTFNSPEQFYEFVREYWKVMDDVDSARNLQGLKAKYGVGPVNNYSFIAEIFGGRNYIRRNGRTYNYTRERINRLIKLGEINILGKTGIEEYNTENPELYNELPRYLDFILSGGKLGETDYSKALDGVNFWIKQKIGIVPSDDLRTLIEDEVFNSDWKQEDSVIKDYNQPPVNKILYVENHVENPKTPEDFKVKQSGEDTRSARNSNSLRSTSSDTTNRGLDTDVETDEFKNHYHKIRTIINKLHEKQSYGDYYVSLVNDDIRFRWDGSSSSSKPIGVLTDKEGNPLIFSKEGDLIGNLDTLEFNSDKGFNNGDNQIVYFSLPDSDYLRQQAEGRNPVKNEDIVLLDNIKKRLADGERLISRVINITPGIHNLSQLTVVNTRAQTNISTNEEFRTSLSQPHVDLQISNNGKLVIAVTDSSGITTYNGVFPPNSGKVMFSYSDGRALSLPEHIINLMITYHKMKISGSVTTEVTDKLLNFVRKIYYTGSDKSLKIPGSFRTINILMDVKNEDGTYNKKVPFEFEILRVIDNKVIVNDKNILDKIVSRMSSMPLNIDKEWFNDKVQFSIPYIEDGIIKFYDTNYQKFLKEDAGLKTNITNIPSQEDLKRYNSIVEFSEPKLLKQPEVIVTVPTEEQVIDKDNSQIKKEIEEGKASEKELPVFKKKKRLAPSYQQILKKICK